MFNDDFFNDDELGDFDEILKEFFKMKNDAPHQRIDEEDFEFLIDYFTINNDKENHIYACEKAVSLYPYSSELLIRKAECYISQKKYGQALKTIDQLDEISPNNINAVFFKSDILLEQNRFAEAAHVLESNLDFFEGNEKTDILLELSEVYDELEDYKKVYQVLKAALLYQPNNEEALLKICFWAEINSLQEDSIELHQHIIDEYPYNPMAWYNLGVAYQGLKLYEKAIDSFSYCIAIDDKFEYAYRNMGDAYIRLKQFKKAIEVLETHLNITKPEDIILEAIGYCWDKQKEYSKARDYYRKASQLNPQGDQIFYKIGETYTKEGQWEKAIKAYSVALHHNKNNVSYCLALGNCLMEIGAEKEALVCYLNAVQLRPDIKSTWQSLIRALYLANYLDEALTQIQIAEDHCGFKVEFVYYKAAILLSKGKTKEAVIQLEEALAINPKKISALKFINKELLLHSAFAEVLVRNKKKK